MGSNVTEFQTELKEFVSQVGGPKLIAPIHSSESLFQYLYSLLDWLLYANVKIRCTEAWNVDHILCYSKFMVTVRPVKQIYPLTEGSRSLYRVYQKKVIVLKSALSLSLFNLQKSFFRSKTEI